MYTYVLYNVPVYGARAYIQKNIAKGTTDPRVEFILPK